MANGGVRYSLCTSKETITIFDGQKMSAENQKTLNPFLLKFMYGIMCA